MAYARKMVLTQDRSISEIATALGFSDRKHFTSNFKEEFGMPIATALGFSDRKHFTSNFKEEFGMPPTAYQKTHKEEEAN